MSVLKAINMYTIGLETTNGFSRLYLYNNIFVCICITVISNEEAINLRVE